MKTISLVASCCSFAALVMTGPTTTATELSLIRGQLENTGIDLDAEGGIRSIFHPQNPHLKVGLRGLTPGASYQLTVDGRTEAEIVADANGQAHTRFDLQPAAGESLLDFDPRGHLLAIHDGTANVLQMMYSGPEEPADIRVDERTVLDRVDGLVGGRVQLRYLEQKNQDRFILHLHALERGEYVLHVDGQPVADIDMSKKRSKLFVFAVNQRSHGNGGNNRHRRLLDFDPRGKVVDLVKDGVIIYSGEMLAQIPGVNVVAPSHADTTLTSTGADADATASARLEVNADGEEEFSVKVLNLPVGDYVVTIAGNEYPLSLADNNGVIAGEFDFSTDPHGNELLLDFDPAGLEIVIKQGLTTFFTGVVNGTLLAANPAVEVNFDLPLLNQEVVDGSAHVFFETDGVNDSSFDVTLSGLPTGSYDVSVGGVVKATVVVTDNAGQLEGAVSFDTQPLLGKLLLDFDPQGQVVTVSQSGVVQFTRTLPGTAPL